MRKRSLASCLCVVLVLPGLVLAGGWEPQKTQKTGADSLSYVLYAPTVTAGKKYPLVVHLHGNGQGPNTLSHNCPIFGATTDTSIQNHTPCFVMGPACPQTGNQPKWVDADWGQCSYSITTVPQSISMGLVIDAIKSVCGSYPIDTNRIEVAGGSMGGMGTWDAVLRHPTVFASASPLSGCGDPSQGSLLVHVPTWAFCDAGDQLCPPCGPRDMIAAIRTAGGLPRFSDIPSGFYHLWDQIWYAGNEFYTPEQVPWMLRQVKSSSVPSKVTGLTAVAPDAYTVNLSWQPATDAVGDPKRIHYFIYRNGTVIGRTDQTQYDLTTYTDKDSVLMENTQYHYTVKAYNDNSYLGPVSDEAVVTTPADGTPPAIFDAMDVGDSTKVLVTFTERLDPASAKTAANYSINKSISVSGAALQPGSRSVLLTVNKMTLHAAYTLTITGVKDQTGHNTIGANSTTNFSFDYYSGLIYGHYNIAGKYPSNPDSLKYMKPDTTGIANSIGMWPYNTGGNGAENFGLLFTGVLQIFDPGIYSFTTSIDDASRVSIDNATVLINNSGYFSGSISLTRGKHAISVSYIQGCCGLAFDVFWQGPGIDKQAIPAGIMLHSPDGQSPVRAMRPAIDAPALSRAYLATVHSVDGTTIVRFGVPGATGSRIAARLGLYDMRGRLVRVLLDGTVAAGDHAVRLGGRYDTGRGQYVVSLDTSSGSVARIVPPTR